MPRTAAIHRETAETKIDLVLDLDGTVYLGEAALPGAQRTVTALRDAGKRIIFCSNNPTKHPEDYAAKLTRLGIPADPAEVFTSLAATVRWVLTAMPGAAVFPIGEQPLHDALTGAGVDICDDPARIDALLVGIAAALARSREAATSGVAFSGSGTQNSKPLCTTGSNVPSGSSRSCIRGPSAGARRACTGVPGSAASARRRLSGMPKYCSPPL